jgi:hypothetical protein
VLIPKARELAAKPVETPRPAAPESRVDIESPVWKKAPYSITSSALTSTDGCI